MTTQEKYELARQIDQAAIDLDRAALASKLADQAVRDNTRRISEINAEESLLLKTAIAAFARYDQAMKVYKAAGAALRAAEKQD